MDSQDRFFKESIKQIHEKRDAKEENFEMMQQQERTKVQQQNTNPSTNDDLRKRADEVSSFIELQEKEMKEFVEEREKLIKEQEEKMAEMKTRHFEEMLGLKKVFDEALEQLMNKHGLYNGDD